MPVGPSGGRLASLLQLAVVMVISIALVQGQTINFSGCQNYQSSPNFNADYVAKLTSPQDGWSMLLTSDRPRTSACQRIIFHSNGSLFISYQNEYNDMMNFTSSYTVHEATFTDAGYIMIEVPGGALGTGFSGSIKLYFIVAENDYFVVATCEQLLLVPMTIELVHAFVPTSQLGVTLSANLNSTIMATNKLKSVESLREVNQACAANVRGLLNYYQIYNILVKLGFLPIYPFRSDSSTASQFYNAVPSSVVYPGYPYPSVYGGPVQSIAYGPAPGLSQPIPTVGQTPAYFYNGPPATSGFPGFTYQTQGVNFVPAAPSKLQSPKVNYDTSAFGSQQSGVTYIPGVPYHMQTPGGANFDASAFGSQQSGATYNPGVPYRMQTPGGANFDASPFGSQQPGVSDMSGAPFDFQSSGTSFDPSTFNFQPLGTNYDASKFVHQSPEVSRKQSMVSARSSGISHDSSGINLQSSVVSQDPSVHNSQFHGIHNEPSHFAPQHFSE